MNLSALWYTLSALFLCLFVVCILIIRGRKREADGMSRDPPLLPQHVNEYSIDEGLPGDLTQVSAHEIGKEDPLNYLDRNPGMYGEPVFGNP